MLDRSRTRAEELNRRGLRPIDAHIVASVEAGDSPEQVAKRLNMTKLAVHAALRRGRYN
jgi:hypothetical protein